MAEFLIKAQDSWMEALTPLQVAALSKQNKRHYEIRRRKGDIIVVRPDGWKWGKEECLPRFVVVKVPGLSIEESKKYEESVKAEVEVDREVEIDEKDYDDTEKRKKVFADIQVKSFSSVSKASKKAVLTAKVAVMKTDRLRRYSFPISSYVDSVVEVDKNNFLTKVLDNGDSITEDS